jgi:hypothetical protein
VILFLAQDSEFYSRSSVPFKTRLDSQSSKSILRRKPARQLWTNRLVSASAIASAHKNSGGEAVDSGWEQPAQIRWISRPTSS